MTDKVQKIRNEVERLQNELIQEREKGYGSDVDDACILELQNVLTYIDSLQEEPISNIWHDASEKSNEPENVVIINLSDNTGEVLTRCTSVYQGRIWAYTSDLLKISNPCKIGKNLQEEPVREDLGEYLYELSKQFPEVSFAKLSRIGVRVAKWQKEQMMAKAFNGYVIEDVEEGEGDFLLSTEYLPKSTGLRDQQKVKVIVIKED